MLVLLIAPKETGWLHLTDLLAEDGHTVDRVESFVQGRKHLQSRTDIDVVIVDADASGRAMIEFVAWVKRDIRLSSIPVIAAGTAFSQRILRDLLALKVEDIMVLPTDRPTLQAKLSATSRNGKKTVLVVDDEPAIVEYLQDILELERFNVLKASSGETAIQVLNDSPVDVIVSDITMPGMSGLELLAEVKEKFPYLPVILVTGNVSKFSPQSLISAGADAFFAKPFKNKELSYTLRQVLAKYSSRRRHRSETPSA